MEGGGGGGNVGDSGDSNATSTESGGGGGQPQETGGGTATSTESGLSGDGCFPVTILQMDSQSILHRPLLYLLSLLHCHY